MQKPMNELLALIHHLQSNTTFTNDLEESKLIDHLLSKSRQLHKNPKEDLIALILLLQQLILASPSPLPLKPLQLLRLLTKPAQLRSNLSQSLLLSLNEHLPEHMQNPHILIEILALHLRFVQAKWEAITNEMFGKVIDLLVMNNWEVTLVVVEITREMATKGVVRVWEDLWPVGRLIFALERLEAIHKPKLINLIKDLLSYKQFNQNFRRINGITTLIAELKRAHSHQLLKLSLLTCIYQLLLTTKTELIYDLKLHNFPALLSLKPRQPFDFKEITISLRILTHLMLDNDMSGKWIEEGEGMEDVIKLLVRSHPTNCHMIKFADVEEEEENQAFQEFRFFLLRLLRYVCSLEKNRKVFKRIFPPDLLGPFIDIGHFVNSRKAYIKTLQIFNALPNSKVLSIEDEYQKIGKIMKNKNFKLEAVGSYNLVEELGQGAFGCVYLAKKGGNQYALKRIKISEIKERARIKQPSTNIPSDNQDLQSYFREVQIYKDLKHPSIIKFYESFQEDDHLYIVMEVVKGSNLSQLIKNQNQKGQYFDEQMIWRLIIKLLSVLRYLHEDKGVIHRDLNPSNIMVDGKFNVKVADFGLAKKITSALQMTQSFVGTLAYSCPQIVQNEGYNEKADIWSFGCIVFQLMTLKAPFSGNNPLFIAKNIVNGEYTVEFPNKYSDQLKNFVKFCLTKEQDVRPSVKDLLKLVVEKLVVYTDELREKEITLTDQIVSMNKKINSGAANFGTTHTRVFGTSSYNPTQFQFQSKPQQPASGEDLLRTTQIVKIDSQILNKIGEDPLSKFIDIVKKLSLIASTQASLKKNFKKYVVDTFYNRVIISDEFRGNDVKNELQKLINLSKQQVSFLGVKFELKQNYIKSITYEMLYFYVEELHELIKKS